MTPVSDAGTAH